MQAAVPQILLALASTNLLPMRAYFPVAICCLALLPLSCANAPQGMSGASGFVDAYFDTATLNMLMSDPTCVSVRFYNARRLANDTKGTAIAIGVRNDRSEIYNGGSWKYRLYDRLNASSTTILSLTKAEAQTRIGYVKSAGEKYYAAEWTRSALATYLSAAGCNGIRLRPKQVGANWSMELHPVRIASGMATVNPAPLPSICTEPCPTYCGTLPSNFIHLP